MEVKASGARGDKMEERRNRSSSEKCEKAKIIWPPAIAQTFGTSLNNQQEWRS